MNGAEALKAAGCTRYAVVEACPVGPWGQDIYDNWLQAGQHGVMAYAAEYREVRNNPQLLLRTPDNPDAWAASLLICLFPYPSSPAGASPLSQHIAEYALCEDYHRLLKRNLAPVAAMIDGYARVVTDTAPLRERYWAARAGLGFIGLNHMLTVAGSGAHFLIATIVTDLPANDLAEIFGVRQTPLLPESAARVPDACYNCRRCVSACPQGCLSQPCNTLDCISYLTIEATGAASRIIDGHIYGCDECRRACPHHKPGNFSSFTVLPLLKDLKPDNYPPAVKRPFRITPLFRKLSK